MADPERRGNFLTRALGIETFRDARREELAEGSNQVAAVLYAGGITCLYYFSPLSHRIGFPRESDPRISKKGAFALIALDAGSIIGASVAGAGFKMAYNLGVEVGQDALRAVRRRFSPSVGNGTPVI